MYVIGVGYDVRKWKSAVSRIHLLKRMTLDESEIHVLRVCQQTVLSSNIDCPRLLTRCRMPGGVWMQAAQASLSPG